jgi:signal transduction histidine kinase
LDDSCRMKILVDKIIFFIKKELFIDNPELNTTFVNRQELVIRIAFWLGFSLNFLYIFIAWGSINKPFKIPINAVNILFSYVPCYYFLRTKRFHNAKFFVYFPPIIFQTISSYYLLLANLPYENAELALIPFVGFPVIVYKKSLRFIGVLLNISLYVFIKIKKYYLFPMSFFELNLELSMSFSAYIVMIFLAYFYKFDFLKQRDYNEKLSLQKQIIEQQSEELKALNSTKDRLFSIIAHDLRSPLSSLKGVMQLLENEFISKEEFRQLSKRLQQNVDNVHGMLENLLLWSLSQMDGIKPNVKNFDLNFVIEETVILFKEVFTQKQINLTNNSSLNLQALGDEYQIRTVLRNLLNNAIKFTPQNGQIEIVSSVEKHFVNLKISDTGMGIRKEDLAQIFSNPKLNNGTAGEKGTGFGLFLCKELIEKNGGSIEIKSEFKKGTTIEILLPFTETYIEA